MTFRRINDISEEALQPADMVEDVVFRFTPKLEMFALIIVQIFNYGL